MFDDNRPLTCWEEDDLDVQICLAPVLVCSEAVQTAGGGDNISAAGLVVQIPGAKIWLNIYLHRVIHFGSDDKTGVNNVLMPM